MHLCGSGRQGFGIPPPLGFLAVIQADGNAVGSGTVHAVHADGHRGAVAFIEERRHIGHQHHIAVGKEGVADSCQEALSVHGNAVEAPAGKPLGSVEAQVKDAVAVAAQITKPETIGRQVGTQDALWACLTVYLFPAEVCLFYGCRAAIKNIVSNCAHRQECLDFRFVVIG